MIFARLATIIIFSSSLTAFADNTHDLCVQQTTILSKDKYTRGPAKYHPYAKQIYSDIQPKMEQLAKYLTSNKEFSAFYLTVFRDPSKLVTEVRKKFQENKAPFDVLNEMSNKYPNARSSFDGGFFDIRWEAEKKVLVLEVCDLKEVPVQKDKSSWYREFVKSCANSQFGLFKVDDKVKFVSSFSKSIYSPEEHKKVLDSPFRVDKSIESVNGISVDYTEAEFIDEEVTKVCGESKAIALNSKINDDLRENQKEVAYASATASSTSKVTKQ